MADRREAPSRPLTDALLLFGFCGFLFFFGLAYFGLVGADEPRYAQVAREMFEHRDWITPTLGGVAWLEKPALYYWQAMIAYRIFGVSDWAARLPSAVDATVLVLGIYFFLRRFRPGFQLDGALMTASAAGIIGFARAASMEMGLAASLTLALLAWYAWQLQGRRVHLLVFYGCLAFGTLAKGPVAPFLAAVIIVLFAWAKGESLVVWRTLWIPGIVLYCLVALPWYIAVQLKNPEFFRVFILQHNLARFGSDLYHHVQPFWYYIPVIIVGLLPWVLFVAISGFETVRAWWSEKRSVFRSGDGFDVFLSIWILVPVFFFSASQSKLPGYILPALPAGTLLLVEYLRKHADSGRPSWVSSALHSVIAATPIVPALMIQYIVQQHRLPSGRALIISVALALAVAAGIVVTLRLQSGLALLRFVTLIPVLLAVAIVLRLGSPVLDAQLSARPLAAEITRMENGTLPLAISNVPREVEYGLNFYRNQKIAHYGLGEVPSTQHVLVSPEGSQAKLAARFPDRRISYLGTYAPLKLDYYWVSAPGMAHSMH